MKDNEKGRMPLNIQLFAEEESENGDATTENDAELNTSSNVKNDEKKERLYTRKEVESIKQKEREAIIRDYEAKQTEAEKLARMDTEQKLNYQLEQTNKENEELKTKINSLELGSQAHDYANQKGLPFGYIEDTDFSKETADSIKEKIDKLAKIRSDDLSNALKDKLKQSSPKAVESQTDTENPYVTGYKKYINKK